MGSFEKKDKKKRFVEGKEKQNNAIEEDELPPLTWQYRDHFVKAFHTLQKTLADEDYSDYLGSSAGGHETSVSLAKCFSYDGLEVLRPRKRLKIDWITQEFEVDMEVEMLAEFFHLVFGDHEVFSTNMDQEEEDAISAPLALFSLVEKDENN